MIQMQFAICKLELAILRKFISHMIPLFQTIDSGFKTIACAEEFDGEIITVIFTKGEERFKIMEKTIHELSELTQKEEGCVVYEEKRDGTTSKE